MSIANAMQTGISGLSALSKKVSSISNNIANSGTVGYKRSFTNLVTATTLSAQGNQPAAGVRAVQGSEITLEGPFQSTSSDTDLSIAGDGYFIVSRVPNDPNQANYRLTRAGSFQPDENGYLVNAAGYYLHGFSYDDSGDIGTVDRGTFDNVEAVNIRNVSMQSSATTEMQLTGNLPAEDTGLAAPGNPYVATSSYFNPLGAKENLSFSWQPNNASSSWTLSISDKDGNPLGTVDVEYQDSGQFAGTPLAYTNITNLAAAPSAFALDPVTGIATITVDNGLTPQQIDVSLGAPDSYDGMTQFAGAYTPQQVTKDGTSVGTLVRTEISSDGAIRGVFDNGLNKPLYQIPLASVRNPDGLLTDDGNVFQLSRNAGAFSIADANSGSMGAIQSNSLEMSNVDIAQELTDLIKTQRAYSSNAKIITTADEMLDETTRIKR